MAYVHLFGGYFPAQFRREVKAVEAHTRSTIALAKAEGLSLHLAAATVLEGWTMIERGQPRSGVSRIRQGMAGWQATGAKLILPYFRALLAEGYIALGQAKEGLAVIAEALALVAETGEGWWEAELHRLKGTLLLLQGETEAEVEVSFRQAETCFRRAIAVARQQEARSLELRATVSLGRLWQTQGKQEEARQMLAEIYNWFTEGFDTADLKEARLLLETLS